VSEKTFSVRLTREDGYRLQVQPGREGAPSFVADETPPIGGGSGATPTELLGAAVGSCLTASLLFCLEKSRVPVDRVSTRVQGTVERNAEGRLRISGMTVSLDLDLGVEESRRAERCLELFEDFCTVKESVRQGIPIAVEVKGMAQPVA
jgi:uncharacterized OsmC-like protein